MSTVSRADPERTGYRMASSKGIQMTGGNKELLARYAASPVVRGLVQLIPYGVGGGLDVAIVTAYDNIQQRRLREFFDRLSAGSIRLSPQLIESDDFLHCFFATVQSVARTHRQQKIHLFANLLSSIASGQVTDVDAYEEYLRILDELSYRELLLLSLLDRYERTSHRPAGSERAAFTMSFWSAFLNEAVSLLSVGATEVQATLTRLNGSGCYATYIGAYGGSDQGRLTALWHKLREVAGTVDEAAA